jgi:hypothetical protein
MNYLARQLLADICQIPIGSVHNCDRQIWGPTAKGEFTVKSAYHLHKEMGVQHEGESSRYGQHRLLWKKLWQMHTPPVVKMFLWRACHNALPTKTNLFRRKITMDSLCPICEVEAETIGHVLWGCPAAKAIWNTCGGRIHKRCIEHADFVVIFEELHRFLDKEEMELVATVARTLWLRRNAVIFGAQSVITLQ